MNCAISRKGIDEIRYFIIDAVIAKGTHPNGWNILSVKEEHYGIKDTFYDIKWTPDVATYTEGVGWDKKPSEMAAGQGIEIAKPTGGEYINALTRLKDIEGRTYAQVDDWIDGTVVDLASARAVLKVIAKVLLALIKVLGHKGRL